MEHRPFTYPHQQTRTWAFHSASFQLYPISFSSTSVSHHQLFLRCPLFLFPWGFHLKACQVQSIFLRQVEAIFFFSQHMQFWKFGGITLISPSFGWGILNFNHIMCLDQLPMTKNIWRIISAILGSDSSIFWTTSVRVIIVKHFYHLSGSTSGPPVPPSSGNSALLGGVVKGANSLFSNIKDMSNKVMQSVAG